MSLKKKKILIIDDDRDILDTLFLLFYEEGCTVLTARSGEEGYTVAVRERPHLIILDIMLPGSDGYRIARLLRKNDRTAGIPILILSAKSTVADIERGLQVKADAYMVKPFDIGRLREKVSSLLG